MPHETATLFFALLAMALVAGLVALAVAWVVGRGRERSLIAPVRAVAVELAAAIAVVAMLGSLYLSEVANFRPCRLCWVQRGFMYPAAVLLVGALVRRSKGGLLVKVAGLLALIGLPISLFHRWDQWTGQASGLCDAVNPCSARWVNHFGFVTIPTMAAIGFTGVLALVALQLTTNLSHKES